MVYKKKAFTLVELMCGMAISLIAISLIYMILNQGFNIFNRTNKFSIIEDSFRNTIVDIENELNKADSEKVYIEDITNYEIDGFDTVTPLILIDNDINSALYFKGKKHDSDKYTIEKVVFDKSKVTGNKINIKEVKTLINEIKGDMTLSFNKDKLLEVNMNEIGSNKENRSYSSLINLNKTNEITLNFNEVIVEPEIPSEPTPPEEIPSIAELFAQYTFIVLDTNGFNKRENLINIQPNFIDKDKNINVKDASFYIQAISTDVMKRYINADSTINNNQFDYSKEIIKAPALKEQYVSNGLTIDGYEEFKNVIAVTNGNGKVVKNNNSDVGYMYKAGNEGILLINGDLNINSNDSKIFLGVAEQGNGQKLTIYSTGKINVNINNKSGKLYINNCTLISANQININSNYIEVTGQQAGNIDKLKEVLNSNLMLQ